MKYKRPLMEKTTPVVNTDDYKMRCVVNLNETSRSKLKIFKIIEKYWSIYIYNKSLRVKKKL